MDRVLLHNLLLFGHILAALLFVAGIFLAGVPFEVARRRDQARDVALLLGLTRFGVLLVALGGLLLPLFGLWLVHLDGFELGATWIEWALILFVASVLLGGLGGQHPKRARKLAESLAAEEAGVTPELRRLLNDPLARVANYGSAIIVVAILVLMVWKP